MILLINTVINTRDKNGNNEKNLAHFVFKLFVYKNYMIIVIFQYLKITQKQIMCIYNLQYSSSCKYHAGLLINNPVLYSFNFALFFKMSFKFITIQIYSWI